MDEEREIKIQLKNRIEMERVRQLAIEIAGELTQIKEWRFNLGREGRHKKWEWENKSPATAVGCKLIEFQLKFNNVEDVHEIWIASE